MFFNFLRTSQAFRILQGFRIVEPLHSSSVLRSHYQYVDFIVAVFSAGKLDYVICWIMIHRTRQFHIFQIWHHLVCCSLINAVSFRQHVHLREVTCFNDFYNNFCDIFTYLIEQLKQGRTWLMNSANYCPPLSRQYFQQVYDLHARRTIQTSVIRTANVKII